MELLFIILIIIGQFADAAEYKKWAGCHDGKKCAKRCKNNLDTDQRTCVKTGKTKGCSGSFVGANNCQCLCHSDCNFDDIVASSLSVCGSTGEGIDKLDSVSNEIGEQIAFGVGGVIAGNIPVVGALCDIGFAAWNPLSPITSSYSLTNDLRKAMNTMVDQLQQCMDEKISYNNIYQYESIQNALTGMYQTTAGAEGEIKIDKLGSTSLQFTFEFRKMFQEQETNYLEYYGMLPIYQSLYPLYAAVATDRLMYLKYILEDTANFENEYNEVMLVFDMLQQWIGWARDSLVQDLEDKIEAAKCRNIDAIELLASDWDADFVATYESDLERSRREIMKLKTTYNDVVPAPEIIVF